MAVSHVAARLRNSLLKSLSVGTGSILSVCGPLRPPGHKSAVTASSVTVGTLEGIRFKLL